MDCIDYYTEQIQRISEAEAVERERVMSDPKAIVPAAFVSFKSRWAAAVCAQTQQTSNPTVWLTEWAPEPRDVYWDNVAIPYVQLAVKKLLMVVALFGLTFFFMIPIAIVQSMASIDGIEKVLILETVDSKGRDRVYYSRLSSWNCIENISDSSSNNFNDDV